MTANNKLFASAKRIFSPHRIFQESIAFPHHGKMGTVQLGCQAVITLTAGDAHGTFELLVDLLMMEALLNPIRHLGLQEC